MYRVNGWFPNYGCSRYAVQAGDVIEWMYTCDLGSDVGGGGVSQGYEEKGNARGGGSSCVFVGGLAIFAEYGIIQL